ncbi:hypothetical protein RRU94_11935 [Domibacillus sp. DTU_2020_1001157_1_SI_ALB_TIR_016]|nr:hypothetical protein [Domibacillus sp. DTU_2020_1001157_1_SI_ALB_TIR_016]WNS81499.1 hypothetical protein RRU94_11935 [Domibacillus sp. DTU_2020_1001157_1_SI_ALB_TIR_016]
MEKKTYNERFEENTKQIQREKNERLEDKSRLPDDQNRMKSVENRRT